MLSTMDKMETEPAHVEYSQKMLNHEEILEEKASLPLNNGYLVPEIASKRAHQKFELEDPRPKLNKENLRATSKRSQKGQKSRVAYRGRSYKLVSPEEFREVVNGFMKFIEELNNSRKQKYNRNRKNKPQNKPKAAEGVENEKTSKKIKYNPDYKNALGHNGTSVSPHEEMINGKYFSTIESDNNDLSQVKEELSTNQSSLNVSGQESQAFHEGLAMQAKKGGNTAKNKGKNAIDVEAVIKYQNQLKQRKASIENAKAKSVENTRPVVQNEAFNRMSEAERMKQLFEMLMMNNPKNLMGLQHSDLNSFTRDIVMKIQNPVLSDKIAKIAMESERVALIPQKKVPTNQYDPKTTLKRATLHVSLAYLIQTRKTENPKPEAVKANKMVPEDNKSQGKNSVASKTQTSMQNQGSTIKTQQGNSQCIEIESDEEKGASMAMETANRNDNSQNSNPVSSQPAINTIPQSSGPQVSCADQQRKEVESSAIIILD